MLASSFMSSFSHRHGYVENPPISIREDMPGKLREPLIQMAARKTGGYENLFKIVEALFDPYGLNPLPSLEGMLAVFDSPHAKVRRRIEQCSWFAVYDVAEAVHRFLVRQDRKNASAGGEEKSSAPAFVQEVNTYFVKTGIGWQLLNGEIVTRGDDGFQEAVNTAASQLEESQRPTAAGHIKSAIRALSERPAANTPGAVSHATSSVECLLNDITGEAMTLGRYLDKHPKLFHPALKKALDGVYGYASDAGARHGKEGVEPTFGEAQFAVTTCAAACTLLTSTNPKGSL
jgi:hypothetical protein